MAKSRSHPHRIRTFPAPHRRSDVIRQASTLEVAVHGAAVIREATDRRGRAIEFASHKIRGKYFPTVDWDIRHSTKTKAHTLFR